MTKVYVAVCHDRHVDEVVEVFKYRDRAIEFARSFMRTHVANPDAVFEVPLAINYGPLELFLGYQYETDHAYVIRCEIRGPVEGSLLDLADRIEAQARPFRFRSMYDGPGFEVVDPRPGHRIKLDPFLEGEAC